MLVPDGLCRLLQTKPPLSESEFIASNSQIAAKTHSHIRVSCLGPYGQEMLRYGWDQAKIIFAQSGPDSFYDLLAAKIPSQRNAVNRKGEKSKIGTEQMAGVFGWCPSFNCLRNLCVSAAPRLAGFRCLLTAETQKLRKVHSNLNTTSTRGL
jgi:hypothetical protein